MKNIHVLQTDKPSRLAYDFDKLILNSRLLSPILYKTQNIYITSDEKIKEGVDQWYLDKVLNEPYNSGGAQYSSKQDVIILTTDTQLIKDGVQAIDDEFLEYYVGVPFGEIKEIEVDILKRGIYDEYKYKIIIPSEEVLLQSSLDGEAIWREEQKQHLIDMMKSDEELGLYEEPKQETLEEAAQKYSNNFTENENKFAVEDFIEGAKYQSERMYSEKDMEESFIACWRANVPEQFKNK